MASGWYFATVVWVLGDRLMPNLATGGLVLGDLALTTRATKVRREKNLRATGCFKLNDGKLFPGQSLRDFFELNREVLHTSSMSHYANLAHRFFVFCFARFFVS